MVMVLLFLGVIFGLVGLQTAMSSGNSDDDSSVSTVTTSTMAPKTSAKPAAKSEVRVYNVSDQKGVAKRTADQLTQGGYNVTEVDNMQLSDVKQTTVYFGDAPGEQETADAVGKLLKAPVVKRIKEIADKPPGVIVLVAS